MSDNGQHGLIGFHGLEDIASLDNLLVAWKEFIRGKRKKKDVQEFHCLLMDNLILLRDDLLTNTYSHGAYHGFKISDPKPRDIHKATVRDRITHHAIYRVLYPLFDRTWISDSYSCRIGKGTHRAVQKFNTYARKTSKNNTQTAWVLKCDIRKFFASIDHEVLMQILSKRISDTRTLNLVRDIIGSFTSTGPGKGLPLGNLTSQMLVNIYMNEFDQFVKHKLKQKYYIRYADDFCILSGNRNELVQLIPVIKEFLITHLKLELHPTKVYIKTIASGVDFLGWVHFPDHSVLRTATKKRMLRNLRESAHEARIESYLGLLSHGNAKKLSTRYLYPYRKA